MLDCASLLHYVIAEFLSKWWPVAGLNLDQPLRLSSSEHEQNLRRTEMVTSQAAGLSQRRFLMMAPEIIQLTGLMTAIIDKLCLQSTLRLEDIYETMRCSIHSEVKLLSNICCHLCQGGVDSTEMPVDWTGQLPLQHQTQTTWVVQVKGYFK